MDFIYDNTGKPYALKYDGTTYYYVLNLQGDVMSIITHWGESYGSYTYDAWGNVLSVSGDIANLNPIRYRGYYYDSETRLYYLGSRYYDPQVKRFINADGAAFATVNPYRDGLTDKNYFAYCDNNPVSRSDDGGELFLEIVGTVAVGLASQYVGDVIGNILNGKSGIDILKPTSTVGEYAAAGVTSLIPGSGLGSTIVRNVVSEGIVSLERHVKGESNSLGTSLGRIAIGSILDVGFDRVAAKAKNFVSSKAPRNYSSYAGKQYKLHPGISQQKVVQKLRRIVKVEKSVKKGIDFIFSAARNALSW